MNPFLCIALLSGCNTPFSSKLDSVYVPNPCMKDPVLRESYTPTTWAMGESAPAEEIIEVNVCYHDMVHSSDDEAWEKAETDIDDMNPYLRGSPYFLPYPQYAWDSSFRLKLFLVDAAGDAGFSSVDSDDEKMEMFTEFAVPNCLDYYAVSTIDGDDDVVGQVLLPEEYPSSNMDRGIMVLQNVSTNGVLIPKTVGQTAAHETGHQLGLFHPYTYSLFGTAQDYEGDPDEACLYTGDKLCDTWSPEEGDDCWLVEETVGQEGEEVMECTSKALEVEYTVEELLPSYLLNIMTSLGGYSNLFSEDQVAAARCTYFESAQPLDMIIE